MNTGNKKCRNNASQLASYEPCEHPEFKLSLGPLICVMPFSCNISCFYYLTTFYYELCKNLSVLSFFLKILPTLMTHRSQNFPLLKSHKHIYIKREKYWL